jgi:hypothetical protein
MINHGSERGLNLNSVIVGETISASRLPDHNGTSFREFPNACFWIAPRHLPFTDNFRRRTSAAGHCQQQDRHGGYHQLELISGKTKWHDHRIFSGVSAIGRMRGRATHCNPVKSVFGVTPRREAKAVVLSRRVDCRSYGLLLVDCFICKNPRNCVAQSLFGPPVIHFSRNANTLRRRRV